MVLNILGRFPIFLLMLGFLAPLCPLAWPKNFTKARWFEIQHIQPIPLRCDKAMSVVNNYTQHCKPENTFLHASFKNVAATCNLPNIGCKNGWKNCHQSSMPVSLTQCTLTSGKYPLCRYREAAQYKFFVIACEAREKEDPPYQLVPVHLDRLV